MKKTQELSLRYLRRLRGLTQEDLAQKIGVDRVTIIRWEKGETSPNSAALWRLAATLRLPPELVMDAVVGERVDDIETVTPAAG